MEKRTIKIVLLWIVIAFCVTHGIAGVSFYQSRMVKQQWLSGEYNEEEILQKATHLGSEWRDFYQGLIAHNNGTYEKAAVYRESITQGTCAHENICADALRNWGDGSALQGQQVAEPASKKEYWEQALRYYDQSLEEKDDEQTQHNRDLVQSRLDGLEIEEQQGEQQEQQGEQQEQQDGDEEGDEGEDEQQGGDSEQENQSASDEQNQQESQLSQYQREQLEQYQEQLQQQEQNNQQYFAPLGHQQLQQLPNTQGSKDR